VPSEFSVPCEGDFNKKLQNIERKYQDGVAQYEVLALGNNEIMGFDGGSARLACPFMVSSKKISGARPQTSKRQRDKDSWCNQPIHEGHSLRE